MAKYFAKVKDTFELTNRFVIATEVINSRDYRDGDYLELRRPDGSTIRAKSSWERFSPSAERPACFALEGLHKADVPIGTEVWLLDVNPPGSYLVRYYTVLETHRQQDQVIVVAGKHYGGKYREGELVELRMPDGTVLQDVESHASDYKPADPRHVSLLFSDSRLTDIPAGTEIWKY